MRWKLRVFQKHPSGAACSTPQISPKIVLSWALTWSQSAHCSLSAHCRRIYVDPSLFDTLRDPPILVTMWQEKLFFFFPPFAPYSIHWWYSLDSGWKWLRTFRLNSRNTALLPLMPDSRTRIRPGTAGPTTWVRLHGKVKAGNCGSGHFSPFQMKIKYNQLKLWRQCWAIYILKYNTIQCLYACSLFIIPSD